MIRYQGRSGHIANGPVVCSRETRCPFGRIAAALIAAVAVILVSLPQPAAAAEADPPDKTETPSAPRDFWTRENLLGDIGGLRSAIAPYGLTFELNEIGRASCRERV